MMMMMMMQLVTSEKYVLSADKVVDQNSPPPIFHWANYTLNKTSPPIF